MSWEYVKNMGGSMILYFVLVFIGEAILEYIFHKPEEVLPLIFNGQIFVGLITLFLSWLLYTTCAGVLITSDENHDKVAGWILFFILLVLYLNDLNDAYHPSSAIGSRTDFTNALIYVMAFFPDLLQIIGFATAIHYAPQYLADQHKNNNEQSNEEEKSN